MTSAICAEMALERARDRGRHGLRAGARQRAPAPRWSGKSTCGSGDTGSLQKGDAPASRNAEGQQGRGDRPADEGRREVHRAAPSLPRGGRFGPDAAQPAPRRSKAEIDHRRREQRQHLADEQAADDGDAERMAQLGAGAGAEHQRQRAEERRQRRHQDRPEAQQAGLVDRLARRLAFVALGVEREVDHHDRVLLDDADQQDDADDAR